MDYHHQNNRTKPTSSKPTSNSDLMASAKILADAAKSALAHEPNKIDKDRVAGAAADFVGAAKHYGKLEEKSFGKYVDKAETYLHHYHSSSSSSAASTAAPVATDGAHHGGGGGGGKHGQGSGSGSGAGDYIKLAQGLLKKGDHGGNGGGSGGGGSGDYIKLAQGLLKKGDHGGNGGGSGSGGGGSGDYIKLAQGLFKKH